VISRQSACSCHTASRQINCQLEVYLQFWHLPLFSLARVHHQHSHHNHPGWDYSSLQVDYRLWLTFSGHPYQAYSGCPYQAVKSHFDWHCYSWASQDRCSTRPSSCQGSQHCRCSLHKAAEHLRHRTLLLSPSRGRAQRITSHSTSFEIPTPHTFLWCPSYRQANDEIHVSLHSNSMWTTAARWNCSGSS